MEYPSEPTSVLSHVLTQVPALDEGARQFFADIDQKLPQELRYFLTRRDGAAIHRESLPIGLIPGELRPAERIPTLEELVAQITPENRHGEIDWGPAVGQEIW